MRKPQARYHRKMWTPGELEFVKTYYGIVPTAKIAEILGRTFDAVRWVVRNQKQKLMDPYQPWTEEEKGIIRTHFTAGSGIAQIMSQVPGRTRVSVRQAAYLLGLNLPGIETRPVQQKWSQKELLRLEANQSLPLAELAVLFPGRTPVSVRKARIRLEKRRQKVSKTLKYNT